MDESIISTYKTTLWVIRRIWGRGKGLRLGLRLWLELGLMLGWELGLGWS